MLLPTTFILIYYKINILEVGSNSVFQCYFLTTLLFFCIKTMLHRCFCTRFSVLFTSIFGKIEKNMIIFCNFFSLCINDLREI